eukprot:TRINITY_DN1211_c0_g1_i1.p1 TRINITY_DN1211_c0_g1~~TRINITY_DN1211_c0_g1_i1.p1  ORF type:complete len:492 (+),score=83.03 TRINITY_DN1211_c0_g1_i1:80-1477(+)
MGTAALSAALTLTCAAAVHGDVPIPPRITEVQAATVARAEAAARHLSAAARPELLEFLGSPPFKRQLEVFGPELAALSAEELLERFDREVPVHEIVHNIRSVHPGRPDVAAALDNTLATMEGFPYFFNPWQLQALNLFNASNNPDGPENFAETQIMGFPRFKNRTWPSFEEASDRVIYGASNLWRIDSGNPLFGDVTVVFNNTELIDNVIVNAMDTGLYILGCTNHSMDYRVPYQNCSGWAPPSVGTLKHYYHIMLPNWRVWNTSEGVRAEGANYPAYNAARMLSRFLLTWHKAPNMTADELATGEYWETDIAMNPMYPYGVRFIIGSVLSLFGTSVGQRLRDLCIANNWPLVWAHGGRNQGPDIPGSTLHGPLNMRVMDPEVLLRINVQSNATSGRGFSEARSAFAEVWKQAPRLHPTNSTWTALWPVTGRTVLSVAPLSVSACGDTNLCVAVRPLDGRCICKQ